VILLLAVILSIGFGIVYGIGQAAGGVSVDLSIFYGFLLVLVAFGVLFVFGRRKQKRAQAERAEQLAARSR
jgi:bacteriorhodopsin